MTALTTQELSDLWDALSPNQQGAVTRAIAAAHAQGRDQGLREAKEACEALPANEWEQPDGSRASAEPTAHDCAAAIEQLRGK